MSQSHQVIVKYQNLEILCKTGTIDKFRQGKLGLDQVVITDEIFKNVQKGERSKTADLKKIFGDKSNQEALEVILQQGEYRLTSAEKRELVEKKRAEIITYIHQYFVDPKLNRPHPRIRIENVLREIKPKIDPDQPVERQVQPIIKRLPEFIPIKKCQIEGILQIKHQHLGQVHGILAQWVDIQSENYDSEGMVAQVSFVPGNYDTLMSELQRITQGDFQFNTAETKVESTPLSKNNNSNPKTTSKKDKMRKKQNKNKNKESIN